MTQKNRKTHGLERGLTNYGDSEFATYLRKSFARSMGISKEMLDKPIVGIAMTPSGFNNCHRGMPDLVEAVSRGVLAAGALPRAFPTISLGEVFLKPTSMVLSQSDVYGYRGDGQCATDGCRCDDRRM